MPRGTPKLDWTTLRVQKSTRDALERLRQKWLDLEEQGKVEISTQRWVQLMTVDDVILELVRRDDAHRERAKAARQAKQVDSALVNLKEFLAE